MIRPLTLLTLLAAAGAGLHLYQTKHAVSLLDRELRDIARATEEAEKRTQVLQAEWARLNEPDRLRAVAQRHLTLEPMQPAQFLRLNDAERRMGAAVAFAGPVSIFAARPEAPGTASRVALLAAAPARPAEPPAAIVAAAPPAAAPVAPTAAAVPPAAPTPAVPATASAATVPALAPAAAPVVVAAATAEPRATETRHTVAEPRHARPAPPRPTPAPRPQLEASALPPVVAPPPAVRPVAAVVARAEAPVAPQAFAGSSLGSARPMLAPPVPFGGAAR